jgi:hypothetical protein
MTEINWLSGIGKKLDINQSNKHFICKWFINSEDDDDLCLGNGSQKNEDEAIKLQELLLTQNPTQEKLDEYFINYIKLYNNINLNNSANDLAKDHVKDLKLINIRTCGLERYLVYLNSNKVGIYVPTKEEEKNLEGKIHFPLYIHESMSTSGFEEAQKKFYEAIDSVRGQIIGIVDVADGAKESNRSKIEGAKFGIGSDSAGKNKFEELRNKFKGGGIMFGQLLADVDDDNIKFNLIGKFDTNTGLLSESDNDVCESNNCDNLILKDYFNKKLNKEKEKEYDNDVYTSKNKNLKIFPKEIYGNNIGIPKYDIKIPVEMRKNINIFCGQDKLKEHKSKMDELRNDSKNLGEKMNINIKKRRELINKVKGLKKDLYENMFLYDKEFEKLSKKKESEESEELDDDELQLFNALEELKTFDKNQGHRGGTRKRRRSRKNKRVEYRKMRITRSRSTKRCGTRGKSKRMGCSYSKSRLKSRKNKKKSRRR